MVVIWLMMVNNMLVGGWYPSEKNMSSSNYDIPNWMEKWNMFQTANQMLNMSNWLIVRIKSRENFKTSPLNSTLHVSSQ